MSFTPAKTLTSNVTGSFATTRCKPTVPRPAGWNSARILVVRSAVKSGTPTTRTLMATGCGTNKIVRCPRKKCSWSMLRMLRISLWMCNRTTTQPSAMLLTHLAWNKSQTWPSLPLLKKLITLMLKVRFKIALAIKTAMKSWPGLPTTPKTVTVLTPVLSKLCSRDKSNPAS